MSSNPPGKSGKSFLLMQQRLRAKDVSNSNKNTAGNNEENETSASTSTNHPTSVTPVQVNKHSKPKGKDFSAMARSQSQTSTDSGKQNAASVPTAQTPSVTAKDNDTPVVTGRSTGKGKDFSAMLNKSSTPTTPTPTSTPAASTPVTNTGLNQSTPQVPHMDASGQSAIYNSGSSNVPPNNQVNAGNAGNVQPMYSNPSSQPQMSYPPTHPLSTNTPTNNNMPNNNMQTSNSASTSKIIPMPKPGGRAALIAESARVQLKRRISGGNANDLSTNPPSQNQTQPPSTLQQQKQELGNKSNTTVPNISLPMRNSFNSLPQPAPVMSASSTGVKSNTMSNLTPKANVPAPTPAPPQPPPKPTPKPTIIQSKLSTRIAPPANSHSQQNPYTITGIKLQNLLSSVSPHYTLDTDAQDQILQLADDFLDKLVSQSMKFAKHRDSKHVDVKDIKLALEKQWGMNVEGFGLGTGGSKNKKGGNNIGKVSMGNGKNGSRGVKRNIKDVTA